MIQKLGIAIQALASHSHEHDCSRASSEGPHCSAKTAQQLAVDCWAVMLLEEVVPLLNSLHGWMVLRGVLSQTTWEKKI